MTISDIANGDTSAEAESFQTIKTVMRRTTAGRSTIYQWMSQGLFPSPTRIGPRRVAWLKADIDRWIADRKRVGSDNAR